LKLEEKLCNHTLVIDISLWWFGGGSWAKEFSVWCTEDLVKLTLLHFGWEHCLEIERCKIISLMLEMLVVIWEWVGSNVAHLKQVASNIWVLAQLLSQP
jgi:hypothetical protein